MKKGGTQEIRCGTNHFHSGVSSWNWGGLRRHGFCKADLPGKPLVSIIMVVFNARETLGESIRSVIDFPYDNLEFLIIDGGSTDGTIDVIRAYESRIDFWVTERDKGIYDAMNKGLHFASGTWCYFLGADDILLPGLASLLREAKKTTAVHYGNVVIRSTNQISGGKFSKYRLMQENICHQAILYPTHLCRLFGFNLAYKFLSDHDLNIRLFAKFPFHFKDVQVAIFDNTGASSKGDEVFSRDLPNIIRKNFGILYFLIKKLRTGLATFYKKALAFLNHATNSFLA